MSTNGCFKTAALLALAAVMALAAAPTARSMGNNGGGVLMVHFDEEIRYGLGAAPQPYFDLFNASYGCGALGAAEDCEEYRLLHPCTYGTDLDPNLVDETPSISAPIMWIVAVFPDTTCVEIQSVVLTLGDFDGTLTAYGWGSLATTAVGGPGWPGENTFVTMTFDPPLTSHEVPLCFIAAKPGLGGTLTSLGAATFWDASANMVEAVLGTPPCEYAVGSWNRLPAAGCSPAVPMVFDPMVCCVGETCLILTEVDCLNAGGVYHPEWNSCNIDNPCLVPAVCCVDEVCSIETEPDCIALGGVFYRDLTSCDPNPCLQAACCIETAPSVYLCVLLTEVDCGLAGGTWLVAEDCDPDPCAVETGACCIGTACSIQTAQACDDAGGTWKGTGTDCSPNPCLPPSPVRVCCFDETCALMTQSTCHAAGGSWRSGLTTCDPNPCLTGGDRACCLGDDCELMSEYACSQQGGVWYASLTSCSTEPCLQRACCAGGGCYVLRRAECIDRGGLFNTELLSCDPDPCSQRVCCLPGDVCQPDVTETGCIALGGVWKEQITSCVPNPCTATPTEETSWGRIKGLYDR